MSRLQKIIVALALLIGLSFLAMPLLLSSSVVKSRIEAQLTELSGRDVALDGNSSLSLYPYLGVSYSKFTLGNDDGNKPLLVSDGIKARVGLLSALRGKPRLSEISLIKPKLNLTIDATGNPNWISSNGAISRRLAAPVEQSITPLTLGSVTIVEGVVNFQNQQTKDTFLVSSINGNIDWLDTESPASAGLLALWRGKAVRIKATSSRFMSLLQGSDSDVKIDIESELIELEFAGTANTGSTEIIKGKLEATSPSFQKLSKWIDRPIGLATLIGEAKLAGNVVTDLEKMTIETATLEIGNHTASGRLQFIQDANAKINVAGTLAFNTLDLPDIHELARLETGRPNRESSIFNGANFDLRLSSEETISGPLSLSNLAATVLVTDGTAVLDVGQAEALGGTVSGTMEFSSEKSTDIAANVTMSGVDLSLLSSLYGEGIVGLSGTGDAKFKLQTIVHKDTNPLQRLNGEGSITGNNGEIAGIDLGRIINANSTPQKAEAVDILRGSTQYETINIGFHIANGMLFFRDTNMEADGYKTALEGRSDLISKSLALSGRLLHGQSSNNDSGQSKTVTLPFFVGGTVGKPLFINLPAPHQDIEPSLAPSPLQSQ